MSTESTNTVDSGLQPGAELRRAREALGRSLEDVAHEMHMNVWQLGALEDDAYEKLASPVFVQGYIRSYARLLEQDSAPLLAAFAKIQETAPKTRLEVHPPIEASDGKSIWLPLATALITAGLVAAFVIWLNANGYLGTRFGYSDVLDNSELSLPLGESAQEVSGSLEKSPSVADEALNIIAQEPLTEDAVGDTSAVENGSEGDGANSTEVSVAEQESPAEADATESPDPKITAADMAETPTKAQEVPGKTAAQADAEPTSKQSTMAEQGRTPPASLKGMVDTPAESLTSSAETGEGPVSLVFDEDSWVEVRDASGKLLIHGLRRAGFSTRIGGRAPYEVFLGNAPGVTISIDGKRFDTATFVRTNRTARFLLQQD